MKTILIITSFLLSLQLFAADCARQGQTPQEALKQSNMEELVWALAVVESEKRGFYYLFKNFAREEVRVLIHFGDENDSKYNPRQQPVTLPWMILASGEWQKHYVDRQLPLNIYIRIFFPKEGGILLPKKNPVAKMMCVNADSCKKEYKFFVANTKKEACKFEIEHRAVVCHFAVGSAPQKTIDEFEKEF